MPRGLVTLLWDSGVCVRVKPSVCREVGVAASVLVTVGHLIHNVLMCVIHIAVFFIMGTL